jgi:signal transduction histidine kinase
VALLTVTLTVADELVCRVVDQRAGASERKTRTADASNVARDAAPPSEASGGSLPLVETIAAGIAHEVRNPLNALQINLSILEQELSEMLPDRSGHVFEVIGKIANELRSLDTFLTEFLRYARPPRLELEPVSVRPLLTDLATFIRPECVRKGVSLTLAAEAGPETVVVDAFQMKHAVLNLVLNALQATPSGGSIAIETGGDATRLEIAVRDTGEGIAEHALARVFDAFFTTREGGTGLGLPIARRIVESHGGALVIHSHEGEGTVARLSLPIPPGTR